MNCMESIQDQKHYCLQTQIPGKPNNFYRRNRLCSGFVKQAFQKTTSKRFQHNNSPWKGESPSKIERLRYSIWKIQSSLKQWGEEKHLMWRGAQRPSPPQKDTEGKQCYKQDPTQSHSKRLSYCTYCSTAENQGLLPITCADTLARICFIF